MTRRELLLALAARAVAAPVLNRGFGRVTQALEQKIPGVEPLGPKTLIDDETILNRLRMAKAVDESLGQIASNAMASTLMDFKERDV